MDNKEYETHQSRYKYFVNPDTIKKESDGLSIDDVKEFISNETMADRQKYNMVKNFKNNYPPFYSSLPYPPPSYDTNMISKRMQHYINRVNLDGKIEIENGSNESDHKEEPMINLENKKLTKNQRKKLIRKQKPVIEEVD